ncbi:MAG: thioredoxin family protein [Candidatus Helarchaeota archaeon]
MSRDVIPPTIEDLKAVGIEIPTEGKAVLDIFTTWCGPCKEIAPILHALRDEGEISLVQEDLDQNRALIQKHNITAIPTLIFFKDGKRIGDVPGETIDMPLEEFFSKATQGMEVGLVKNGTPINDISTYSVQIKRYIVKDGVMVGYPGEELLRKVIKEM